MNPFSLKNEKACIKKVPARLNRDFLLFEVTFIQK
jgi:hypothetical protein